MPPDATPAATLRQDHPADLLEQARAYVEYQISTGLVAFPVSGKTPAEQMAPSEQMAPAESRTQPNARASRTAALPGSTAVDPAVTTSLSATSLDELRDELGNCQRCKLAGGRTNIVFGVGNPQSDLLFVGEGPGRDEDRQAEPFVGRAGKLLTDIITKGMQLERADVYIANVVKCRPPDNRDPQPDEIATCRPFLERQIELIQPQVIVALGRFAAQTMLGVQTPISRLRGRWHDYHGIKLMPTLHPAYLLRNPSDKKLVWEDIKMVMRELGLLEE